MDEILDTVADVVGSLMISQFDNQEEYREAVYQIMQAFKENITEKGK